MIIKGKIVLPVLNVGPLSIYPLLSFLTCSTGTTGLPKKKVVVLLPASFLYAFCFGLLPLFFSSCSVFWWIFIFYFFIENVLIAILYYST